MKLTLLISFLLINISLIGQIDFIPLYNSRILVNHDHISKEKWSGFTTKLYSDETSVYHHSKYSIDVHFIKIRGNDDRWIIRAITKTPVEEYNLEEDAYLVLDKELFKIRVIYEAGNHNVDMTAVKEAPGFQSYMNEKTIEFTNKYTFQLPEEFEGFKDKNSGFLQLYFGGIPYSFDISKALIRKINAL